MNGVYNFEESKEFGDKCEAAYGELMRLLLIKTDGRKNDFMELATGDHWELKSDDFWMQKTPHLFIERWSRRNVDGGPWQSKNHNVKKFVYWYVRNGVVYEFSLDALLERVERLIIEKNLRLVPVYNEGYTAYGYLIRREWVADLAVRRDIKSDVLLKLKQKYGLIEESEANVYLSMQRKYAKAVSEQPKRQSLLL
jgi:hypothetical protein